MLASTPTFFYSFWQAAIKSNLEIDFCHGLEVWGPNFGDGASSSTSGHMNNVSNSDPKIEEVAYSTWRS